MIIRQATVVLGGLVVLGSARLDAGFNPAAELLKTKKKAGIEQAAASESDTVKANAAAAVKGDAALANLALPFTLAGELPADEAERFSAYLGAARRLATAASENLGASSDFYFKEADMNANKMRLDAYMKLSEQDRAARRKQEDADLDQAIGKMKSEKLDAAQKKLLQERYKNLGVAISLDGVAVAALTQLVPTASGYGARRKEEVVKAGANLKSDPLAALAAGQGKAIGGELKKMDTLMNDIATARSLAQVLPDQLGQARRLRAAYRELAASNQVELPDEQEYEDDAKGVARDNGVAEIRIPDDI